MLKSRSRRMGYNQPYAAIQSLLARWSHLLDDRDYERLGELLAPDAVMQFPSGVEHLGRDAIRDAVASAQPERPIKHLMGLPDIEFESESKARVRTDMVSFIVQPDRTLATGIATRYDDRVELFEGKWVFRERRMRAPGDPSIGTNDA